MFFEFFKNLKSDNLCMGQRNMPENFKSVYRSHKAVLRVKALIFISRYANKIQSS